jgi:hypothetical protein
MVSTNLKKQMMDYLVSRLEGNMPLVSCSKLVLSGQDKTSYIKVGDTGLVLVIDRIYSGDSFSELYSRAQKQSSSNVATVFIKDGKTFFRSAAQKNYFKQSNQLSLKNYTPEQMQEMLLLRSEEIVLVNRARKLQYYQPESPRLEEGVETFDFGAVRFDYSHIDPAVKFKPKDGFSERLFLHKSRNHQNGQLDLISGYLVPRK